MSLFDEIFSATDEVAGSTPAMKMRRFAQQVQQRSFGSPKVTTISGDAGSSVVDEGSKGVAIEARLAPDTDFPSAFILDPKKPSEVKTATVRLSPTPPEITPLSINEDVFGAQDRVLRQAADDVRRNVGLPEPTDVRIRREFPGPFGSPEDAEFVPHVEWNEWSDPLGQDEVLRFMDQMPERLSSEWERLANDFDF